MPIKRIGSPHPKYLAATDILISDMSNINYDFLIYNRPIVLLANKWVRDNFPDIGIKTDLEGLEEAIRGSIDDPGKFEEQRKYWHKKTMHLPDGNSSSRILDLIIGRSGFSNPYILLIHGNNDVSRVHLEPLYDIIKQRGLPHDLTGLFREDTYSGIDELLCISTHNEVLSNIKAGYKVHIDHSVKGKGVTDFEKLKEQYEKKGYYAGTDLQVTEGEVSYENTRGLMGPFKDRVIMAGYPKSDTLIKFNTGENKDRVHSELGFNKNKLLITYAPTGRYRAPFKLGASLSGEVLAKLREITVKNDYNMLIKLRNKEPVTNRIKDQIKRMIKK